MAEPANVLLAPTSKTTETVLPDWYTNYGRDIAARQLTAANTPYTARPFDPTAGFTPQQMQAFQQYGTAATAYQPGLQQATQIAQTASEMSPLMTAQPYLAQAGQLAPNILSQYMNPYTEQVVNRVGELGARTLREQLLPQISDQFVRAGGYGGSRQAEAIGRSLRDVAESTQAKQAELLAGGYGASLTAAQNDLQRLGNIAGTAGQVSAEDARLQQGAAEQFSKLGGLEQSLGIAGANALQGSGALQQGLEQRRRDTATADFMRQQGYPQEQIDAMVKTLSGVAGAVPKSTLENAIGPVNSDSLSKNTNLLQDFSNLFTTIKPFLKTTP
jgi:hypothetical protein